MTHFKQEVVSRRLTSYENIIKPVLKLCRFSSRSKNLLKSFQGEESKTRFSFCVVDFGGLYAKKSSV
ncbi:hypothetical protein HZS_3144 [Henneguya salminicola]|nr:hypothetical protein HZS_3144 [Henneguya salminicola]